MSSNNKPDLSRLLASKRNTLTTEGKDKPDRNTSQANGRELFEQKAAIPQKLDDVRPKSAQEILSALVDEIAAAPPVLFSVEAEDLGSTGGLKQKYVEVLAEERIREIAKRRGYGLTQYGGFTYVYTGKHWVRVDEAALKDFLGRAVEAMGYTPLESRHHKFRDNLYKQFVSASYLEAPENEVDKTLLNLQNGTIEVTLEGHKLRPHERADFLKYVLPFGYEPAAKCPIFEKFINQVLPEIDAQLVLAEFVGYAFTRSLKLEKMLLLYGSGANGKSVFFDVIMALLGRENVSNCDLSGMEQEHMRALLADKLLNYGSEIKAAGTTPDTIKKLASNEPIDARQKYGKSFTMYNYGKFIFNCNELPKEIEHSEAFFRRFLIIGFDVTIAEEMRDPDLSDKIIKNELPGVFNWVLEGLKRLLANRKFSPCEKAAKALNRYRRESDTVLQFMEESEYEKTDKMKPLKDLYFEYKEYCRDCGNHPLALRKFSDRLQKGGYAVERRAPGMMVFCGR